ncbi:MAG: ergothioneine biosynthesis protein EgtB [Alphaproteobacteria bacterium]|nr:ergothioneine biosynthesis protein EgtB [Alphaproteobacteria bacterium]
MLDDRDWVVDAFSRIRDGTERLAAQLHPEDMAIQAMPDASPTKWHLAHTTWFFEEFILKAFEPDFAPHHEAYGYLFNSYYDGVGPRWARPDRGLLSRPTVADVFGYREAVTRRTRELIERSGESDWAAIAPILELGLHHEQQHQELICTDIKYALSLNPIAPTAFASPEPRPTIANDPETDDIAWVSFNGGLFEFGADGADFHFDNEGPRRRAYLDDFELAATPVTNGDFLAFINDGGYDDPRLWLSDGWDWRKARAATRPLYWRSSDNGWSEFTLHGERPLDRAAPASHLSAYEAFAYATWAGARAPTEFELELATLTAHDGAAEFLDPHAIGGGGRAHPTPVARPAAGKVGGLAGGVWEWTTSAYAAYPGYSPPDGAIGEYNGKFMSSQLTLRGGSCLTPEGHWRPTYRNFFPPAAQWQCAGLRLARGPVALRV